MFQSVVADTRVVVVGGEVQEGAVEYGAALLGGTVGGQEVGHGGVLVEGHVLVLHIGYPVGRVHHSPVPPKVLNSLDDHPQTVK